MFGLAHQEGCRRQKRKTLKLPTIKIQGLRRQILQSQRKEGWPVWLHHGQCRWATSVPKSRSQKAEASTERQEDLRDLTSHRRTISTDTGRWAQGPWIKQCLSPAQAPVQKQQQSQAACSSACLTRSEWWRHWVPYWRWLGSSGPRSRPAAWNRKTHSGQNGLRVLTARAIRAPPRFTESAKDRHTGLTGLPPEGSLPAEFLSFVGSWDLCHATFGHLRGSCL